jgi:hypothetical protein
MGQFSPRSNVPLRTPRESHNVNRESKGSDHENTDRRCHRSRLGFRVSGTGQRWRRPVQHRPDPGSEGRDRSGTPARSLCLVARTARTGPPQPTPAVIPRRCHTRRSRRLYCQPHPLRQRPGLLRPNQAIHHRTWCNVLCTTQFSWPATKDSLAQCLWLCASRHSIDARRLVNGHVEVPTGGQEKSPPRCG